MTTQTNLSAFVSPYSEFPKVPLVAALDRLVEHVKFLIAQLPIVDVLFQPQVGSKLAHSLAQVGMRLKHQMFWEDMAPFGILPLLDRDRESSCGDDTHSLIRGIYVANVAWNTLATKLKPAEASKTTDEESELHTNHTLISGDAGVEEDSTIEVRVEGPEGDANDLYMPFFQTLLDNDWDAAMEYVRQHPEKLNATFEQSLLQKSKKTTVNHRPLHFVVSNGRFEIAKELVQLMSEEDLEILDSIGRTALHLAVLHRGDSHEIVKCMVEKNKKLLSIRFNNDEIAIPFVLATIEGRVAMSQYLYSASPLETLEGNFYFCVVMSACVVQSRFGMHVPPTPTIDTEKEPTIDAFNDARTNAKKLEGDQANQRHIICLICTRINRIYRMKEIHVRVDEFLQCAMKTIKLKRLQKRETTVGVRAVFLRDELQELERIVDPVHRETKNLTDRITPRPLFTMKHKELVKEGAKSMKETSTSCTVVGALIVTMMFAQHSQFLEEIMEIPVFLYS
ncbi:unnamed protein product [Prunus brigantina]